MAKQFNKVQDSGERQEFNTGSVRDTNIGKGRFDLVPAYAFLRLAQHYENGTEKYGDRNWELGQPLSRYVDSAIRHMVKVLMGLDDEDHLAAAAWNVMAVIETQLRIKLGILPEELDDLPTIYKEHFEAIFGKEETKSEKCSLCKGDGEVDDTIRSVRAGTDIYKMCPKCGGSGEE